MDAVQRASSQPLAGDASGTPPSASSTAVTGGRKDYLPPTPKARSSKLVKPLTATAIRRSTASNTSTAPEPRPPLKRRRPEDETQAAHIIPPAGSMVPYFKPLPAGPRPYGTWVAKAGSAAEQRPWALVLFSGRARRGDLTSWLAHCGFLVCAIDTAAPEPVDLLDEAHFPPLYQDVYKGKFSVAWAATPCGSFSPHERRPGPPRLRTAEHIEGLPDLGKKEKEKLREANLLVERTADVLSVMWEQRATWGLENPDHPPGKPSIWLMPLVKEIADYDRVSQVSFDQCTFGLDTVKPTRLMYASHVDFSKLDGRRCQHPKGTHQSTAGRQVADDWGNRQWASKDQGEYTAHFSQAIAEALYQGYRKQALEKEDL